MFPERGPLSKDRGISWHKTCIMTVHIGGIMRVGNHHNRVESKVGRDKVKDKDQKGHVLDGLKKSDLMADIFNNNISERGEKRDARLNISRSSQALVEDFKRDVVEFLSHNKDVAKELKNVELSEDGAGNNDFPERKMRLYIAWLSGQGASKEGSLEEEDAFLAVHRLGKDKEIIAIYEDHERKVLSLRSSMIKNSPTYYYQVFPEAYSFN